MGPIAEFLTKDHGRLDALLQEAGAKGDEVDLAPFGIFREGILRHIGMEEKILIPALARCPGAPVKLTEKMRLDHSAIANLMMPEPSRAVLAALRRILEPHNHLEEDPGGFYEACDALLAAQAEELTKAMRSAPEIPLRAYSKRPQALAAAKRAMARAGFDWDACTK
jgi:hypothetical protein